MLIEEAAERGKWWKECEQAGRRSEEASYGMNWSGMRATRSKTSNEGA